MYGIIQPTVAKLHLLLHPPLVEDHLVWETIFIWIQVRSLKRGTTVQKKIKIIVIYYLGVTYKTKAAFLSMYY